MTQAISHDDDHVKAATMDSEKQAATLAHDKVDAALEFLNAENTPVTEVDEKRLVRKIDWRIVPLMCKSWAINKRNCKENKRAY